jgi:hypothetical protein
MISKIDKLDRFGSKFQMNIKKKGSVKTPIGGFLSLIVYGLGFVYLIFLLLWWINGETTPKM